jgi:hypothetical protein
MRVSYFIFVSLLLLFGCNPIQAANCRLVEDESFIQINKESLRVFEKAGLTRNTIFDLLKSIAMVETSGCWAGISQNFDGQLISAGVLQWNYGQNSIQPALKRFKQSMGEQLPAFVAAQMPMYGSVVLSDRCLANTVGKQPHICQANFLDSSDEHGQKIIPALLNELTVLFEKNEMIQIQMDLVMAVMEKSLDFSKRLFGNDFVSQNNFHWMLDIIVQQGGFDNLESFKNDVDRAWARSTSRGPQFRQMTAKGILVWYAGHSISPDQGGLDCDWRYNIEKWSKMIASNAMDDEKFRLFLMSWMRARTASGESGRWQALSFQRRAKIGVGIGSVGHSSAQRDNNYDCIMPVPEDIASMLNTLSH